MGVAGMGIPSYAAMIPQGFGAGVGKVGPYYEQGNWYRGGAVQMLFIAWISGEQNQIRPMFPPDTSREDFDSRFESIRSGAAVAAGRLVEGSALLAGDGHYQSRRRAAWNFRRQNAGSIPEAR